jgi:ribosomal protein L2
MFTFIYNKTKRPFSSKLFPNPTYFFLYQLRNNLKVSLLEIIPGRGAQYARSSGTKAHLIKVDMGSHTALVKLPSGVRKIFSAYSLVMFGAVSLKNKRLLRNTRSGY